METTLSVFPLETIILGFIAWLFQSKVCWAETKHTNCQPKHIKLGELSFFIKCKLEHSALQAVNAWHRPIRMPPGIVTKIKN